MRKLMFLTIGFACGCVLGSYLLFGTTLILVAVSCLLFGSTLWLLRKQPAIIISLIALGIGLGAGWLSLFDSLYLQSARQYDGKVINTEIEIADYSRDTQYGIAADGRIQLDGKQFRVYTYLKGGPLKPGDVISGEFRLRFTGNGGQEDVTFHPGKGIFLLTYAQGDVDVTEPEAPAIKFIPAELRRSIQNVLDSTFPADAVGFARALLLGDSSKLSPEDDTAFQVSGIRHVIAVSGLHVSILFSFVYCIFGKRRIPTAFIGIPLLVLFAAIAGFTPSIVRACIMQCLMIFAMLFKKEYDPPTALSFAVLTMLIINPLTITSASFQLSVGCIIGIFLLYSRIYNYLLSALHAPKGKTLRGGIVRWFVGSVSVTLSAMAITTHLTAYYFGAVSVVGILTNLLTLWVISFVFYGCMLACMAGFVCIGAGKVVGMIIAWPIRYVLFMSRTLASIPISSVYTSSIYIILWLVFCLVLVIGFLLMKRKKPIVLVCCMILGLGLSVAASYLEPKLDDFRVTVMDVGQGQSVLLQSGDKTILVDCGGDTGQSAANTVAQQLLSQGITRLDSMILTHFDDDHAGGAAYLMNRIPADKLYLPDCTDDGNLKEELKDAFSDRIVWTTQKDEWLGDWGKLTIFPGDITKGDNNGGLCVLFQAENCDILITGDWANTQEMALVQSETLPQLELLVVGHHGSASSTSFALLSETTPKATVISVGEDNSYGHPADEVLERLEMFGCEVWRTDLDGTLIFGR